MTRDMFRWPVLGFMLKNRYFLVALRVAVLGLFFYAIVWGFLHPHASRGEPSLTTALFWGLFWPFFMVLSLATFGPLFCGVCPHGFVGRWLNKTGLKKPLPQGAKKPLIGTAVLILGYWAVIYAFPGFYKTPWAAAALFGVLTLYAFALFYIYDKMAYCKVFCPIGAVTRAFGRVGFAWLTTDQKSCANCDKSHACAKACPYGLNPERFDAINSMEDCKLCMKCAHACDAVRFEARAPASSLFKPMPRAKTFELWTVFAIVWMATMTMQFHHGLGFSSVGHCLPWAVQGRALKELFGAGADWTGVMAMLYSLAATVVLGLGGLWLAAKLLKKSFEETLLQLGWAYAPLMIFGSLFHVGSFFFFHYYSDIVNGFNQAFFLGFDPVQPLASRRDAWVHIVFGLFKYIGLALSALILWRRVSLLGAQGGLRVAVFGAGWLLGLFYLGLQIYRALLPAATGMHNH
ncbi:MAG: 4Fe-4S binding protein [Campylobacterales bacterium]